MKPPILRFLLAALGLALGPSLMAAVSISLSGDSPALPTVVAPGGTATFSPSASPAPGGRYQWYFNDTPLGGATAVTLTLSGVTANQTGNYRLKLTTTSGATEWSNTLTLNVVSPPPSPVDTSFTTALPAGVSSLFPLAVANDGRVLLQASTTVANHVATQDYLRLLADGTTDPAFTFPGAAGTILATFADGGLITSKPPYRLNPDASPAAFTLPAFFDATLPLTVAGVQSDGKFLLGQGQILARFNADGTPDPTFVYAPTQAVTLGWIKVDLHDRIIVHGTYPNSVPTNWPMAWNYIFRLTTTGAVDAGFTPTTVAVASFPGDYYAFYPLTAGGYLVLWSAEGLNLLVRFNDDGTEDPHWSSSLSFRDGPLAVDPAGRVFRVYPDFGATPFRYALAAYNVTASTLALDSAYYPGQPDGLANPPAGTTAFTLSGLLVQPDGRLLVSGTFTGWDGHATPQLARLRTTDSRFTPVATILPPVLAPHGGDAYTLGSQGAGGGSFSYQWLALDGQPLPANTTSDTLTFAAFTTGQLGRYQLRLTGPVGSTLSPVIELGYDSTRLPYLSNLSGRALSGTGENIIIAGLTAASPVHTLVRGAGPALQPLGVAGFLPNPALNVYNVSGTLIGNNDNWGSSANPAAISDLAARAGAFAFATGSLDAAGITDFARGNYTIHLFDQSGGSGVGLLEIYADPADLALTSGASPLVNLSFRAKTAPGEATAIAGFVIVDPQNLGRPARVLLRAVGPTLSTQGVQHPLADPVLTVYNSKGEVVAQNDNWPSHLTAEYTAYDAATDSVGAFHLASDSKDAGLLLDLPAGAYSMHATGGTGVVLLEIYLVR